MIICWDWNPAWHRPIIVDTLMNLELMEAALEIVDELASPAYLSEGTSNQAILLHGSVSVLDGEGIDVGLSAGDHYFLEALARRKSAH